MFSNSASAENRLNSDQPVNMTPEATRGYQILVQLAGSDNYYWAQIAVEVVDELLSGLLPENSILIASHPTSETDRNEYVLTLPGCKVHFEKSSAGLCSVDFCKILSLEVDTSYGERAAAGGNPGLYSASRIEDGWDVDRKPCGFIAEEKNRLVAICDSVYKSPSEAAEIVARRICQAPMSGGVLMVKDDGFDLHFTPGERSFGGWKNYHKAVRPNQNTEAHESALLLASAMYQAKDVKGVAWISEDGGSAVLTQAMTILSERGVKLPNHTAFLFNPTTPPDIALKAAQSIGLNLDSEFTVCRSFNIVGNGVRLATFNILKFIFTAYFTFLSCAALLGFLPDVLPDGIMRLLIDLQVRFDGLF